MKSRLLALALVFSLAGAATASDHYAQGNAPYANAAPGQDRAFLPFNPVGFKPQPHIFGAADISDYGNGAGRNEGFFASYERVFWSMSKPSTADIGSPTAEGFYATLPGRANPLVFEQNSVDTDFLRSDPGYGNRFDLGFMDTNDYGWLVSVLSHVTQTQGATVSNATVLFNDPQGFLGPDFQDANQDGIDDDLDGDLSFGRDGIDFDVPHDGIPDFIEFVDNVRQSDLDDRVPYVPRFTTLQIANHTQIDGVEVMRMYRAPRLHNGGTFEMLYGARLLSIEDRFSIIGTGGVLEATTITNQADNRIVGPQLGGRYSHRRGKWTFSAEGRFSPAINFQTIHQDVLIASIAGYSNDRPVPPESGDLVPGVDPPPPEGPPGDLSPTVPNPLNGLHAYGLKNRKDEEEFAPLIELRLQTVYQATRSIGIKFGYTAMFVDGIARGSNTIDYTVLKLGVAERSKQDMFVQGINLGIEFNR